jgi:hypothetical protein
METEGVVDIYCSAFFEFCIQANDEEKQWLDKLFKNNRTKKKWRYYYDSELKGVLCSYYNKHKFVVTKKGLVTNYLKDEIYQIILKYYPWSTKTDYSTSLLSREALTSIYSHLKDPNDMWSFMRVNKRFHRAGCLYSGYSNRIENLRLFCGLEKLPFEFMSDARKRFFALCFVSCQKDLEGRVIRCIEANGGGTLFQYCLYICGINMVAKASFLDGVSVRIFQTYGAYSKHYILHSNDKSKSQFSKIKESIKKIVGT